MTSDVRKSCSVPTFSNVACLIAGVRTDYNQTHFVRNETFKKAADKIQGPTRKIFVEFLERSCTAEFSGFLLYKELGRRLKKTNPVGIIFIRSSSQPSFKCVGHGFGRGCPLKHRASHSSSLYVLGGWMSLFAAEGCSYLKQSFLGKGTIGARHCLMLHPYSRM